MREQKPARRLNQDEKRQLRVQAFRLFVAKYARKAPKHGDPDDRAYSHEVEQTVARMRPEQLDALLHGDD